MKKLILIFALSTVNINSASAFSEDQEFNIAGIKISAKICAQVDKLSAFTTQLTNVNWTVAGAPGYTMGVVTNPSVILDFCNMLNQLQHLSLQDAIFGAMELGNTMMGNKFDDELNFMRDTYDLTASAIDMSGKGRGLAGLYNANFARRLNKTLGSGASVHNKYNPKDPSSLKSREKKEADMARLGRLASRRAVLNDLTDCPKGRKGDEKLEGMYEKDVMPVEEKIESYQGYVEHFRESLKEMGIPSLPYSDYEKFLLDLSTLEVNAVSYDIEVATRMVDTVKRVEIKQTASSKPTDDRSKEVNEKLAQKYQLFKVKEDTEIVANFDKKYTTFWTTYANLEGRMNSGFKNQLNDPVKNNVERKFTSYSILCNKSEIIKEANIDSSDPNFYDLLMEEFEKCKEKKDLEIESAGGLFKFYIEELHRYNKLLKEAQAYVWTFESYYLGYFRVVEGQASDGIMQEKATCSQIGNLGAINDLMAKQGSLNLEINQELVAETMKQNAIMEQEKADREKQMAEAERKRRIDDEIRNRMSHEFSPSIKMPKNNKGF